MICRHRQWSDYRNVVSHFSCGYLGFERSWLGKLSENNPRLQVVDLSEGLELLYGTHHHERGASS